MRKYLVFQYVDLSLDSQHYVKTLVIHSKEAGGEWWFVGAHRLPSFDKSVSSTISERPCEDI